jgi:hypothetical protein
MLREPRMAVGLPRGRSHGWPRSLQQQQGGGRTGDGGLSALLLCPKTRQQVGSPACAPATSSAAATSRPIA